MGLRSVSGPVLRNKGIPVELYELARDADGQLEQPLRRALSQADEPVVAEVWLQMTNLALADIEEQFGELGKWQEALQTRPFGTIVTTLALCLDMPRRQAGLRMIDGRLEDYSSAVGGAFMLANGVEPEKVGEVLARGVRAASEARSKLMAEGIDKMIADQRAEERRAEMEVVPPPAQVVGLPAATPTPGPSGSLPGAVFAGQSPSSGT